MSSQIVEGDTFIESVESWRDELATLCRVLRATRLTEAYKWKSPCYTFGGKNIAILASLKDCCPIGFFKGVLLKDAAGVLEKPGDNSRSARVVRFKCVDQVQQLESTLKEYVEEAITLEQSLAKVDFANDSDLSFLTNCIRSSMSRLNWKPRFIH